jgi:hypothetical protein
MDIEDIELLRIRWRCRARCFIGVCAVGITVFSVATTGEIGRRAMIERYTSRLAKLRSQQEYSVALEQDSNSSALGRLDT